MAKAKVQIFVQNKTRLITKNKISTIMIYMFFLTWMLNVHVIILDHRCCITAVNFLYFLQIHSVEQCRETRFKRG